MTFESLDQWREKMGFSIGDACRELDISWDRWDSFRSGRPIPRHIELACAALFHRLEKGPTL
jgi:hypothetical protein